MILLGQAGWDKISTFTNIFLKAPLISQLNPGSKIWLQKEDEEGAELVLDSPQHRRHISHSSCAEDHC